MQIEHLFRLDPDLCGCFQVESLGRDSLKVQRQEVQELEKNKFCIKITVNLELKLTVNVTVKFDTQYMKKKLTVNTGAKFHVEFAMNLTSKFTLNRKHKSNVER